MRQQGTAGLTVEDLSIDIAGASVVDGVSFSVGGGEVMALVGESGCGKSLTAFALLGLLPDAAEVTQGHILLDGLDLASLSERELRRLRGSKLSIIFQEPTASLDPLATIGSQIAEAYRLHHKVSRREALAKARAMLVSVGIPDPDRRLTQYPFELSGGMCQRVMIAIALICGPDIVPRLDVSPKERLATIDGSVPSPERFGPGCRFNERCPLADGRCRIDTPPLLAHQPGHFSACWHADRVSEIARAAA
jgi:peptide/nickel transport system ATP-binding protein